VEELIALALDKNFVFCNIVVISYSPPKLLRPLIYLMKLFTNYYNQYFTKYSELVWLMWLKCSLGIAMHLKIQKV
jgi:hypothetical protein